MTGVLSLLGACVGLGIFGGLLTWGLVVTLRHARRNGVLLPVAVGGGLRLSIMLLAHFASVGDGDRGFMFLDDRGYAAGAARLADQWSAGNLVDPTAVEYAGSYSAGYFMTVAAVFLLVGAYVLAPKLLNVLLSTATVLVAASLGAATLGERARRPVAWAVALMPTLVWWAAPMMKEALVGFLFVTALLGVTRLHRRSGVVMAIGATMGLLVVRPQSVLAGGAGVAAAFAIDRVRRRTTPDWRALARLAAMAVATVASFGLLLSHGRLGGLVSQYSAVVQAMIHDYRGSSPAYLPVDAARSLVAPYPWVFESATATWDRALYPGMWLWYFLLPTVAMGCWHLRHRAAFGLLVVPATIFVLVNAFTSGFVFRQRSTIEPLLLILVVAGADSARAVARRGALGLGLVVLPATVQSGSLTVGAVIAAGALAVLLAAQRLPDQHRAPLTAGDALSPSLQGLQTPTLGSLSNRALAGLSSLRGEAPALSALTPGPAWALGDPPRLSRVRSLAPAIEADGFANAVHHAARRTREAWTATLAALSRLRDQAPTPGRGVPWSRDVAMRISVPKDLAPSLATPVSDRTARVLGTLHAACLSTAPPLVRNPPALATRAATTHSRLVAASPQAAPRRVSRPAALRSMASRLSR